MDSQQHISLIAYLGMDVIASPRRPISPLSYAPDINAQETKTSGIDERHLELQMSELHRKAGAYATRHASWTGS